MYYLSTATFILSANTAKHCWYKLQSVVVVVFVVVVVVVYKNKNELESSPVGFRCNHTLVMRRITDRWVSPILKIRATPRGTRMSLILKI